MTICECGNGNVMTERCGVCGRVESSSVVLLEPTDSTTVKKMNTGHRRFSGIFSGLMPHFFDFLCCFLCVCHHPTGPTQRRTVPLAQKPEPRFRFNSLTPPASRGCSHTPFAAARACAMGMPCCGDQQMLRECCLWWRRDCGFGGSGRWALKGAGWLEASSRSSQASAPRAPAYTTHTRACGDANGRLISNNLSYTNLTPL